MPRTAERLLLRLAQAHAAAALPLTLSLLSSSAAWLCSDRLCLLGRTFSVWDLGEVFSEAVGESIQALQVLTSVAAFAAVLTGSTGVVDRNVVAALQAGAFVLSVVPWALTFGYAPHTKKSVGSDVWDAVHSSFLLLIASGLSLFVVFTYVDHDDKNSSESSAFSQGQDEGEGEDAELGEGERATTSVHDALLAKRPSHHHPHHPGRRHPNRRRHHHHHHHRHHLPTLGENEVVLVEEALSTKRSLRSLDVCADVAFVAAIAAFMFSKDTMADSRARTDSPVGFGAQDVQAAVLLLALDSAIVCALLRNGVLENVRAGARLVGGLGLGGWVCGFVGCALFGLSESALEMSVLLSIVSLVASVGVFAWGMYLAH